MDVQVSNTISPQSLYVQTEDNTLLIVDDDKAFLQRLARAMETRGFAVEAAGSVEEGLASLKRRPPAFRPPYAFPEKSGWAHWKSPTVWPRGRAFASPTG